MGPLRRLNRIVRSDWFDAGVFYTIKRIDRGVSANLSTSELPCCSLVSCKVKGNLSGCGTKQNLLTQCVIPKS